MPWDANIASTKFVGKLPLQSFNNLMGAIRERCNGAGVTIPTSLATDFTKFELLPSAWFSNFQSTMTTLIPLYANHTDNSGNWDGQTTIPAWNTTAGSPHNILALCDTTTRIVDPSSIKCAAWAYQQYQMLNLMRWRRARITANVFGSPFESVNETWYSASSESKEIRYNYVSWADCQNEWSSTPWTPTSYKYASYYYLSTYNPSFNAWYLNTIRTLATFTFAQQCSVDIYHFPVNPGDYFEPINNCDNANIYNFYKTLTESNSHTVTGIDDSDYLGLTDPSSIPWDDFGNWSRNINPTKPLDWSDTTIYILKFTGAGGFTFRDW